MLEGIAGIYVELGQPQKALPYEQRALELREKVLGPNTGDVADSLTTLAQIWGEIGDCKQATAAAKRSIEVLHGLPGGDENAGLPTLIVAMCTDDVEKARPLYIKTGELLAKVPGADHELTIVHTWLAKHPQGGK